MATIGITLHRTRPEAVEAARTLVSWLVAEGHEVCLPPDDGVLLQAPAGSVTTGRLAETDLVVSLGGDGTVLRTVELLAGAPVPVLGVNLGHLGYLTEVEPDDLHGAITRMLDGGHDLERRMLLEVTIDRAGEAEPRRLLALNEALIDRSLSGHTVRMDIAIDGRSFTPYEVDGLIVATPTGSTAYGLSAGGPVVAPTHRLLLLTPVSPHMLLDRTLVLEASSTVSITMAGHRDGELVVDGRAAGRLAPGDVVRCTAATEEAHLVVFGPRDFPGLLKAKFKLGDR
jgi:NAD+ kinase